MMRERLAGVREAVASLSPEGLLVGGFGGLVVAGTLLLWLPWARSGSTSLLDALFTATSAVCVTGLVVVDTGTDYTAFGQIVILLLIQAGGIGVMIFAGLAFLLLGHRLSLRARAALGSSMLQRDVASELRSIFGRILRFVLVAEGAGAVLIFIGLLPARGVAHAAYSAIFHSVSAFCNAGFSLYPDSLSGFRGNPLVLFTVMGLIVLGGIGHPVVVDVWQRLRPRRGDRDGPRRLGLSSAVALWTSAALLLAGFALLLLFGSAHGGLPWSDRVLDALFQSVSARTAGFNTVDIGELGLAPLFVLVLLMFIGGSPGSCAGGIKTTTFTLWLAKLRSRLRGEKSPRLFGRHIPGEITRRVSMIIGIAVVWNLVGVLLLLAAEGERTDVGLHDVLFEQISAFGTVGLSTGLTPGLGAVARLWLVATMLVGRLGPLTIAMWIFARKTPGIRYPEGRIMIG
ncbi:MAG: ATPase [Deltaproteobacteria bacterium]|nr:ATPase [Deltaproteobacteria bacterium]